MKQQIKIESVTIKESQNGKKYASLTTNAGTISCFESDIYNKLSAGKTYDMEISKSQDGKFLNARRLYGEVKDGFYGDEKETITVEEVVEDVKPDKFAEARLEKNAQIEKQVCIKSAKDLVISGVSKEDAVKIVKYLRENF
tara:strand:+ start:1001 stop:1423 length:423 start_codon:yes stop_codon:yes gene_type:complete